MHAFSGLTNSPYYKTLTFSKDGSSVLSPNGDLIFANSKDPNARMWYLPTLDPALAPSTCFVLPVACAFVKHEPTAVFVARMSACFFNPPVFLSFFFFFFFFFSPSRSPATSHASPPA